MILTSQFCTSGGVRGEEDDVGEGGSGVGTRWGTGVVGGVANETIGDDCGAGFGGRCDG